MKVITSALLLMVAFLFMTSCSSSSEAKTRKEQEEEFNEAFEFYPPSTITTINYADHYRRVVMEGYYDQWMSFTFEQASFDKIIQGKYKEVQSSDISHANSPAWWPKTDSRGTAVFSRTQDDTTANEGFQFVEYIWHDKASGLVFFQKCYWD